MHFHAEKSALRARAGDVIAALESPDRDEQRYARRLMNCYGWSFAEEDLVAIAARAAQLALSEDGDTRRSALSTINAWAFSAVSPRTAVECNRLYDALANDPWPSLKERAAAQRKHLYVRQPRV